MRLKVLKDLPGSSSSKALVKSKEQTHRGGYYEEGQIKQKEKIEKKLGTKTMT